MARVGRVQATIAIVDSTTCTIIRAILRVHEKFITVQVRLPKLSVWTIIGDRIVHGVWPVSSTLIADFLGLPYFSGFPSGLKSHVLISHDFLSQSKCVPLPRDRAAMCSRPASKHQKKFCFVSKQACKYCIRSED